MQKTLRIFRKDTRHLWPEILLTLALTLGFALSEHYLWPTYSSISGADVYRTLTMWMNGLMPIAWWLLIARAVHDESLVGDLQFWVTRPYGWQRVLTAKLLFLAAFILVPFFLSQCYLLHQAGLHPLAVLPGLLLKLLILFAFLLLPLLALSTVTASLTRMLLVFIGFFIYLTLTAYFLRLFTTGLAWTPGVSNLDWMWYSLLLIPAVALAVTLLQYARRRTVVSTGLLIGLTLLLTVILIVATRHQGNVKDYTPLAADQAPLRIALDTSPSSYFHPDNNDDASTQQNPEQGTHQYFDRLALPVVFSDIAPGHAIDFEGSSFSVVDSNGSRHEGGWSNNLTIYNEPQQITQYIDFSKQSHAISADKPIAIHLTYAIADYQAEPPTTVTFKGTSMTVPSGGHCQISTELDCQYPLKSPARTLVTWHLQEQCGAPSSTDVPEQQWIGEDNRALEPVLDPVVSGTSLLSYAQSESHHELHLCSGTTFTFTSYHLVGRHRVDVTLPPIDPKNYSISKSAIE